MTTELGEAITHRNPDGTRDVVHAADRIRVAPELLAHEELPGGQLVLDTAGEYRYRLAGKADRDLVFERIPTGSSSSPWVNLTTVAGYIVDGKRYHPADVQIMFRNEVEATGPLFQDVQHQRGFARAAGQATGQVISRMLDDFAGIPVVADPSVPENEIRFRHPDGREDAFEITPGVDVGQLLEQLRAAAAGDVHCNGPLDEALQKAIAAVRAALDVAIRLDAEAKACRAEKPTWDTKAVERANTQAARLIREAVARELEERDGV